MTEKTTAKPQNFFGMPSLDALKDVHSAGSTTYAAIGTAWAEALSDMGAEVLGFVAERVKEDVQTQHQLMHAKSLQDIHHIQNEFVQKALDQYSAETGKLVEMSQSAMAKIPGAKLMPD
ncbi:phasin family protein [Litoreibacter janthinus]|uniref:Phasin protein n=1 Tax=Litoreibacter janthinus TaxID=670154 RepID=A0A1I6HCA9_9RHOB|nr:phasin family protein [Litoreibacter janthinus]SFR52069.1 Phasin protein [Litoreibacter janthinus]